MLIALVVIILSVLLFVTTNHWQVFNQQTEASKSEAPIYDLDEYVEKIQGFLLQVFRHTKLNYQITGKTFFSFENQPNLLLAPVVVLYDQSAVEKWRITAVKAYHYHDDKIQLNESVHIVSLLGKQDIKTELLWLDSEKNQVKSDTTVLYRSGNTKVVAQAMVLDIKSDQANFFDGVKARYE